MTSWPFPCQDPVGSYWKHCISLENGLKLKGTAVANADVYVSVWGPRGRSPCSESSAKWGPHACLLTSGGCPWVQFGPGVEKMLSWSGNTWSGNFRFHVHCHRKVKRYAEFILKSLKFSLLWICLRKPRPFLPIWSQENEKNQEKRWLHSLPVTPLNSSGKSKRETLTSIICLLASWPWTHGWLCHPKSYKVRTALIACWMDTCWDQESDFL